MLLHSLKKASLLSLLAAVALASACRSEPEAPPEAPVVAPAEPVWTPEATSPRYAVTMGADGAPQLMDGKGQVLLPLGLTWEARYGEAEGEAGCQGEGICTEEVQQALGGWSHRSEGEAHTWSARFAGPLATLEATWQVRQGDPRVRLSLRLTYTSDAHPDREAVYLTLPGAASHLDESLRFVRAPATGAAYVGPWTPHRVIAGEGGSGEGALHMSATGLEGLEVRREGSGTRLGLELDDARSHPLRLAAACDAAPGLKARDRQPRRQGEVVSAEVDLWLGHTWAPIPHRLPNTTLAALAVIDDASAEPAHLRALLQGHSDPGDPRYGNGGFLGHALPVTLGLRAGSRGYGRPENAAIVRESRELGLAVANLGPQPEDAREDSVVEAGITAMQEARTRLWIDPAPALRCQGPLSAAQPRLAALLASRGYTLIEAPSEGDAASGGDLNLLGGRAGLLWRHASLPEALHLLRTRGAAQPGSWRDLDSAHLNRLIQARGVSVVRSHLGTTVSGGGLQAEGPHLRPTGELEKRLFDIGQAQEDGDLWVTTPEQVQAALLTSRALRMEPRADGAWRLSLPAGHPAPASVALWLPGASWQATLDGQPLDSRTIGGPAPAHLVTFPLQAGKPALLKLLDAQGRSVQPLVPVQWSVTPPGP